MRVHANASLTGLTSRCLHNKKRTQHNNKTKNDEEEKEEEEVLQNIGI